MTVAEIIKNRKRPIFSLEILPPLKGNDIQRVYSVIDKLLEFEPQYINITSHHSEYVYKTLENGSIKKVSVLKRPGTVAIAAAIQNKYNIPTVPHIICSGFTRDETEYALLDLNFLGINNLLLLRGDQRGLEIPSSDQHLYNKHALDLQEQVNRFNQGVGLDNQRIEGIRTPFSYGMACYPEKHEEAPNMESDIRYMKCKMEKGASYFVTQMFFDNNKYFSFVERCRREGITVPIIPGIKPVHQRNQLNVLPKIFHTDIPEPLAQEMEKCKSDDEVQKLGVEWCVAQCNELLANGVPGIHFYTLMASESIRQIANRIF